MVPAFPNMAAHTSASAKSATGVAAGYGEIYRLFSDDRLYSSLLGGRGDRHRRCHGRCRRRYLWSRLNTSRSLKLRLCGYGSLYLRLFGRGLRTGLRQLLLRDRLFGRGRLLGRLLGRCFGGRLWRVRESKIIRGRLWRRLFDRRLFRWGLFRWRLFRWRLGRGRGLLGNFGRAVLVSRRLGVGCGRAQSTKAEDRGAEYRKYPTSQTYRVLIVMYQALIPFIRVVEGARDFPRPASLERSRSLFVQGL